MRIRRSAHAPSGTVKRTCTYPCQVRGTSRRAQSPTFRGTHNTVQYTVRHVCEFRGRHTARIQRSSNRVARRGSPHRWIVVVNVDQGKPKTPSSRRFCEPERASSKPNQTNQERQAKQSVRRQSFVHSTELSPASSEFRSHHAEAEPARPFPRTSTAFTFHAKKETYDSDGGAPGGHLVYERVMFSERCRCR